MEQAAKEKDIPLAPGAERSASLRAALLAEIGEARRQANRGLYALSLFLMVSTLAWREFWFLPPPERLVASLGPPPRPMVISLVLVVYTFSAIVLSLSRMMSGIKHKSSFCHVGYLAIFFLFYYCAGGLADNYWAVFGAGFTILCVESYRIWNFCSATIHRKHEQLAYLERTGHLPPEETEHLDGHE